VTLFTPKEQAEAKPLSDVPAPAPRVFPSAAQRRRREAAAALDGKKLRRRFKDPNSLEPQVRGGALPAVPYLGPEAGLQQPLEAHYTEGTTERFTPAGVKPWLLRVGRRCLADPCATQDCGGHP
jgi:hypothetical protein